jgi:hypothetical protein
MATRIRTLNFLPDIFKTPTNAQFLRATLDQIVDQPNTQKIEGYIGSKFGYGINPKDYYVTEPTKTRTDYQLEPGVVFTKNNESTAQDFISYPGIIDALKLEGAITDDNNRLFTSQFYSWDSFTNLDKIINFNQYYWLPNGPEQVVVSADTVFISTDYIVNDAVNGYNITTPNSGAGSTNPTLTLLRGGTYTFAVNQTSQFWIQGEPGVTGYSLTQPNVQTRDVLGVTNNGTTSGIVTFTVPNKNAQDEYNFPGNNPVGVVSTLPFVQINGARVSDIGGIDGITSLEGLTVMFYNTGVVNESGFISNFFDYTAFDVNNDLVPAATLNVTATSATGDLITCNTTSDLTVGSTITFTGTPFGGLSIYSETLPNTLYYVESVVNSTQFTVSLSLGGSPVTLTTATGSLTANINQGLMEEGYYTQVNNTFYTVTYVGDPSNPTIRLLPAGPIPIEQKIIPQYGTEWINRTFYKDVNGNISLVPYLSCLLDTLYYQDGTTANKVGVIRLIDSNTTNRINVETDILGRANYTASNGVVFTNGLKVVFEGDIYPASYKTGQYYVEGVGSAIELIAVSDLIAPEAFTVSTYIPYDTTPYDISNFDSDLYIPVIPDYITIARNSINKNAWSRSNRWFHIDVINASATYNNNPSLVTTYATNTNKAKRPIIEFYPNLALFNSGAIGKAPVDFIDMRTTDAFSQVAGQENYYPDVASYTTASASFTGTLITAGSFVIGKKYKIVSLGTTNFVAIGASANTVGTTFTATGVGSGTGTASIYISQTVTASSGYPANTLTCGSTSQFSVNDKIVFTGTVFGGVTSGAVYYINNIIDDYTFMISLAQDGDVFPVSTDTGSMTATVTPLTTTVTVATANLFGSIQVGQYITDSTNLLPTNSIISAINQTTTTTTITVTWTSDSLFLTTAVAALVTTDTTVDNYALFEGSRIVFTVDEDPEVRNKIYVAHFSTISSSGSPVLTLSEASDGEVLPNEQTVAFRGYNNAGKDFHFDGIEWFSSQQKVNANQPPLFDVYDSNGISFGDRSVYVGSSFAGSKLFAYGIASAGLDDTVLGFPVRYSSVDNVGDISFDVSLNSDTFDYVSGTNPITQKVNTGYVYNYTSTTSYVRELGWQTAVAPSIQYQLFQLTYGPETLDTFFLDIAPLGETQSEWPVFQVYADNVLLDSTQYSYTTNNNSTTIVMLYTPVTTQIIEVVMLSDQVSKSAFYTIPVNLNNNPLNEDLTVANIGDIRGQYQSIFYNNPNTTGEVFGPNNYRDLGNVVPWGNKIIQNSASLVLPSVFLRKQNHNLFNALMYNSREYISFKSLLIDTVNKTAYSRLQTPAEMLDNALDQMAASKTDSEPFFWSDMLPSKAAYVANTYSFANSLDVSIYPLTRVYDFATANYYGVLVYLVRTTNGVTQTTQLIRDVDYTVSATAPSLTVTLDLLPNDQVIIKEYNQTYGSYAPNTPTKMGLYPASIPGVVLDSSYTIPTYFIKGHDGSYNKLYGSYDPTTNSLVDFRDQALLEYETRVYNNLKLSNVIPIQEYEVMPGFFRNTDYSNDEILKIYSETFLNWVGQNRVNYKRQIYNKQDQYSWNYYQSGNKIDKAVIQQGNWRGVYQYFYDTTNPDTSPWEMLGFKNMPSWWSDRYGPAPYTSDNLVLWGDLAAGINWNNGNPVVIEQAIRPQLLEVLPVDSEGNLVSPFVSLVGNYNSNIFQRDWKVGDAGPAEFSYRRSSSYPFDLMRILALTKPAEFFNLGVDVDHYKYNAEFNQYLVNNRSHLKLSDIDVYGNGTAVTSYVNWIVDYEKQVGVDATQNISDLLKNVDVRLIYRVAGFTDKNLLKFYVEKGTPNSRNASLLIPDESYSVLLYDNQPFDRIVYSGVIIQLTKNGYTVFGNSQSDAYFTIQDPLINGNYTTVEVDDLTVKLANDYADSVSYVPYNTEFYTVQEVSQFIESYGTYLERQGVLFDQVENGVPVNWRQMVAEFMYWSQTGWQTGSIVTMNPAATLLAIDKENSIVQPLTLRQQNFILNQNLYPIQAKDMSVLRDGTAFTVQPLNQGDTVAYGQFNMSNFEHGIVFDNVTLFNDIIYNTITGLRQTRILTKGTKTAEWNGTVDAQGFILNQDNIQEWNKEVKYTTGSIVKYKNKYWIATKIIQAKELFEERDWKQTDYNEIQKGLLPNSSTRSYESTLYYDVNKANLENDADLLSFSLIGYRPRDYMALADLTDITQVNVYKNMIKNKGTRNATNAFKGANLPQGGIDYELFENWAILSGEFGGVLNSNFVEFKINEKYMTGNPSIVGLTRATPDEGVQQEVPIYSLFNYGRPVTDANILPTVPTNTPSTIFPDAGYVNFNDVKMVSYFYNNMASAINQNGTVIPLDDFYVRDYVWLADYLGTWQVYTPTSMGQVVTAKNNLNGTVTLTFATPHNLSKYEAFAVVNFDVSINGYYITTLVIDPYRVIINLNLNPNILNVTGQGIGFKFQSQRVATPADIANLPLLDSEFIKNKVWVDANDDGAWAVYRKGINYQYESEITKENTVTFGSAVAYTSTLGYLISDAGDGKAYRYTYNDLTNVYNLVQTISHGTSFGTAIAYADNIFAISEPTTAAQVHIYDLQNTTLVDDLIVYQSPITALGGSTNWGSAVAISGDKNWLFISATDLNRVYVYRLSQVTSEYEYITYLTVAGLTTGDLFGYSIATDYYGDTVVISAPGKDYSATIDNWGYTYVFDRSIQNIEALYTTPVLSSQNFTLAWTPSTITTTATATVDSTNRITCTSTAGFVGGTLGQPVIFSGSVLPNSNIDPNTVYYIKTVVDATHFTISLTRNGDVFDVTTDSGSMIVNVQSTPLYVSVNGTILEDNDYAVIGNTISIVKSINAGDIVNVSGNQFTQVQVLTTEATPRVGVHFGQSVDTTTYASEIIVGAPFALNSENQEGAVYRYTNGGGKYGVIIGTSNCSLTVARNVLINGYLVSIPAGDAVVASNYINSSKITNVQASAFNGKLVISLIDNNLATPNEKLILAVTDSATLAELGISIFTQTQVVTCPHKTGPTQFGNVVKFNQAGSFVASAPTGTRYVSTTFDFSDDENQDDDTIFDNNTTQWVDSYPYAGAVYMFDYLAVDNESLLTPGKFAYAQSVNALNQEYGAQPLYGHAVDFSDYHVIVGTPNFTSGDSNGQVITYINASGQQDWSVYRSSSPVVDINRIQNIQLFSAETNNTLDNLDYIDPLQGKILGSVRENIDFISNIDPAGYNTTPVADSTQRPLAWTANKVGQIWFDTSAVRFVNYHQNDNTYNSKYWSTLFPGSNVAVYTWISSNVPPSSYTGPGVPYDRTVYSVDYISNPSGSLTPVYFFWARNTNIIFENIGKTLADSVIQAYILSPKSSGIAYFTPLLPNVFGLYNCSSYINANDTVLHIGYSTGTNDDVSHSRYSLIRANYADDFLPGLPTTTSTDTPQYLYDRMLDSMCGVDETGAVVPNPYLPKAVQLGVLVRPRQSFFINRFLALKNYLTYANEILSLYPITETRQSAFLNKSGEFYNTSDYWNYVNWWAVGYNDNTKSAVQVPIYADLAALEVSSGTIARVAANGDGKSETYVKNTDGTWTRIGLTDGTIAFSSALWDYAEARLGFGDNFYDTNVYDEYPSEQTRYIIRALNEQIYINDLLIYRNKSLILMFEYIQSETIESQNYLPWLNKTSFIDVAHTIRELLPLEVFQSDNQDFLSGYINEVKPYHVVVKEFLFKYTKTDVYEGDITDFDLPAKYNTTLEKFITPELVYSNPSSDNQYLPSDAIWNDPAYSQWFNNYGVTLTGQPDYPISMLATYIALNTNAFAVDNAYGFPINGVVKIGTELIGYSDVDRNLNVISGLTRGVDGTAITTHIPGETISMDLPAVLVLNGGRGYAEPPKVTAYIDTTIYPEPDEVAQLVAVMNLDSVLSIEVVNPGKGYAVLPEIIIDSAVNVTFSSSEVSVTTNTIQLYAPLLATGDIVKYDVMDGTTPIQGLAVGQWYYVRVLETVPTVTVGLYSRYNNAVNDQDRIELYSTGTGVGHILSEGARASCISSSSPVRENNIAIRFDRTTYNSQVIDWLAGRFYGSYYAGTYNNSQSISSSGITLETTQPPIDSILASAQGVSFEMVDVTNDQLLTWSSFIRSVKSTESANDSIRLSPLDGNNPDLSELSLNASGTTIGFYVGMPVKFKGAVGSSNIVNDTVYYVKEVLNELDFTISTTVNGSVFALGDQTISVAGLQCFVGEVTNTALITVNYPGIRTATNTTKTSNIVTAPLNPTGTGGTAGFYVNLPIFFTGNVFGGVIENLTYYVTTVIDSQTFTMSENQDPVIVTIYSANASTNIIVGSSTLELAVNDPVIFNNMTIAGSVVTNFGGIIDGTIYYVSSIINPTNFTISEVVNGGTFDITSTVVAASTTSASMTSQVDTVALTTATGEMAMNVSLPVSPGQVNGQLFTMYPTSEQYSGLSGTNGSIISRSIVKTLTSVNRIAITENSGGLTNVYNNLPVKVASNIGGLTSGTQYYVIENDYIEVEVTNTSSTGNALTCSSTASLYVDMPIIFSGTGLGTIDLAVEYYVKSIPSSTQFTVTNTPGGIETVLTNDNGTMTGTGSPYIVVSTTLGGSAVALSTATGPVTIDQTPIGTPVVDASYIMGGYRVVIEDGASGYAVDNTITILGTSLGGATTANDLVMTVDSIDSNGVILSVICSGTPAGSTEQYYLKVVSANQFEVYSNSQMTIPVSGIDFPYYGVVSTIATETVASSDEITVEDSSTFDINDPVVFTGTVFGGVTLGQTYYVIATPSATSVKVSETIGGSALALSNDTGTMTMAKFGDFIVLPEPFSFNQSVVKYNNRVYRCIVSNNDVEFIFGKWELLDSGNRYLNALDRIIGYYQPTANMPGLDLTQLVEGITYPNSTYKGNAFAPEQQFELDTILQDQPFYPTQVDNVSITWDGLTYLGASNTPDYSAVIASATGDEWTIAKLANTSLNFTDMIYAGGFYVLTTRNAATPIYRSNNGIDWTSNGQYTPYSATPYDDFPYDVTALDVASISLNSVGYSTSLNLWVAVGENIVTSSDTYIWRETFVFDDTLIHQFNGVDGVSVTSFTGFVAVGKGQEYDYSTGVTQTVYTNILMTSTNGLQWNKINSLTTKGFNSVTDNGSLIIVVGENGVIYSSVNSQLWLGVSESFVYGTFDTTNQVSVQSTLGFAVNDKIRFTSSFGSISSSTDYWIKTVDSSSRVTISTSLGGSTLTLTNAQPSATTQMYHYPETDTLNDVYFADSLFVAVGENGIIRTSSDGYAWTTQTSGTSENLNGVMFNSDDSVWIVVGDNNVILQSSDSGITWESTSLFTVDPTIYDVQGNEFMYGYGPEELVPGLVTDTITMTIATRPGTNWLAEEYAHVGYNVVSKEITPISTTQTVYSFARMVQTPTQLAVFEIDGTTGLSTTLVGPNSYSITPDYTIDWVTDTIILNTPLGGTPTNRLRVDVYETGNGDQLVKASTKTDPIRLNTSTGWDEIYVNCNYSAPIFNGSGLIQPGTSERNATAIQTDSTTDTILFEDVSQFSVNEPITFQGAVFGGILEDTTYYVKTVSTITNKITVSLTYNITTSTAGPTLALTSGTGSMVAVITVGSGAVWTAPLVYRNGGRLLRGTTGTVTKTNGGTNTITCNTTGAMIVGMHIVFSDTMFGNDIETENVTAGAFTVGQTYTIVSVGTTDFTSIGASANTRGVDFVATGVGSGTGVAAPIYFIDSIVDSNEFTISKTYLGATLDLSSATGGASFITNDFAFGIADNGVSAKMMFASHYDARDDYITYTLFGETTPEQYGYTIPEVQYFTGATGQTEFILLNNDDMDNVTNAVVEIDGVRVTDTEYTIDAYADTLTFVTAPSAGAIISVTSYNDTLRQYFTTQYGITGNTVSAISAISNAITSPIASTNVTATDGTTEYITCVSTTGFIVGQTVEFKGTGFGGIATDGTVYFVRAIIDSTHFTIQNESGTIINLSTASGLCVAYVGGQPAVRVTTNTANGYADGDVVIIDGTTGSTQLNNQIFYVKVISSTQFDLYSEPYNSSYAAVNYPVTDISAYTGGGYTWIQNIFPIITVESTGTTVIVDSHRILANTTQLVVDTPVLFSLFGTQIGDVLNSGIVVGTTYYVKEIFNVSEFSISETRGGSEFALVADAQTFNITQWEQENVDRLWVTVNGYRVPSSSLRINPNNQVSILTAIASGDEVIMTSMIPSATPNEEVYQLNINQTNQATVYRANTNTRTWLTAPLYNTSSSIQVQDVTRVTDTIVQEVTAPAEVDGVTSIGLTADKNIISAITVYNNTSSQLVTNYTITVVDLAPTLVISSGVSAGDSITITIIEGNLVYINGEQIKFTSVDLENNTLSGLQRGTNGTGEQFAIPLYAEVFGILSSNRMTNVEYAEVWNSYDYNTTDGDPLQISNTAPAIFLNTDVS